MSIKWTEHQSYMLGLERYYDLIPDTMFHSTGSCCLFSLAYLLLSLFSKKKSHFIDTSLQVSFTEDNLRENVGAFMSSLLLAKPTGLKKCKWHTLLLFFLYVPCGLD